MVVEKMSLAVINANSIILIFKNLIPRIELS